MRRADREDGYIEGPHGDEGQRVQHHHSAGGLVVRGGEVLLDQPTPGRCSCPRGTSRPARTRSRRRSARCARRPGSAPAWCGAADIDYVYDVDRRLRIHKRVDYYLMVYVEGSERDVDPREVLAARWWPWDEALAA